MPEAYTLRWSAEASRLFIVKTVEPIQEEDGSGSGRWGADDAKV